jgi:hypothetical protein
MSRKSSLGSKMSFKSGLGWFCIYNKPIIYRKFVLREFWNHSKVLNKRVSPASRASSAPCNQPLRPCSHDPGIDNCPATSHWPWILISSVHMNKKLARVMPINTLRGNHKIFPPTWNGEILLNKKHSDKRKSYFILWYLQIERSWLSAVVKCARFIVSGWSDQFFWVAYYTSWFQTWY